MSKNIVTTLKEAMLIDNVNKKDCQEPVKVRHLEYVIEFSHINPRNLSEESLDRDPYQIQWSIEAEPFNKTQFILMRSNLQNLLTESSNSKAKSLLVDDREPKIVTDEELVTMGCTYSSILEQLNCE